MQVQLTEAPRDAWQGLSALIPAAEKIAYLRQILSVGFDYVDCVSFVSPKSVPQMSDSLDVLNGIQKFVGKNKLLAIVGNLRGAKEACKQATIYTLGYPLSLSETFQLYNTKRTIKTALKELEQIHACCKNSAKICRVFLSMGFGNPYGDKYNETILLHMTEKLQKLGIEHISIADTVGIATPRQIEGTLYSILHRTQGISVGAHLHSTAAQASDKIAACYQAGCRHFDATLQGHGGCPMTQKEMVGNLPTEAIISYLEKQGERLKIDKKMLSISLNKANVLFKRYGK